MKKLTLLMLMLFSISIVQAENSPFAPTSKHGRHKVKKNRKAKKSSHYFACGTSPKKVNRHGLMR